MGEGRFLATPTSECKGTVTAESLIVVDGDGALVQGTRKAFSEFKLHRACYRARGDVQAVVHAHPPMASAFGVSGRPVPHPFLPEAVVSLGAEIPTVPLATPGSESPAR